MEGIEHGLERFSRLQHDRQLSLSDFASLESPCSIDMLGVGEGKLTFKNLVRSIIRASRWKISLGGPKDGSSAEDLANKTWYEDQETLHFNVNAFKSGNSGNAGLSKRAKFILMKNAWERTDEELELIHNVVDQMKSFEKYSPMVRRELVRVMHFETFEDGRVMLREGHQGFSMYFIVAGSVVVQVIQEDTRTNEKKTQTVGEISAGSSFGELALVQDCTRTATIVCKGTSQFLRVDKPDFDMVLRRSYEKEWQDRLQILSSIPFFKLWTEADLRPINLNCRVEGFASDTVILGNTSEVPEHVYFVVSGLCKLIRQIKVLQTTSHIREGNTMLSLPPKSLHKADSKHQEVKIRFLEIGVLEFGDCFGAGEDMDGVYVMAFGRAECLMIPRHTILTLERLDLSGRENRKVVKSFRELRKLTRSRLLSETDAFEKWMINLGWRNYKKKISSEILAAKGLEYKPSVQSSVINEPNLHHQRNIKFVKKKNSSVNY